MKHGKIAILLAGGLLCAALSGCGGAPTQSGSAPAEDGSASTEGASAVDSAVTAVPDTSGDTLYSSVLRPTESPEWVQNLPSAQDEAVTQLFVVAGMGMDKTTAAVSLHQRDADGNWNQILSSPAVLGRNGLCDPETRVEGCGQTPLGVYRFNKAFGISPDPGCAIPYQQVDDDDYWSGDQNEGMRYNELVSIQDYPDLDVENSEHIVDYDYHYRYCLNISFNEEAVIGRGSGIFLHCFGPVRPYTAGCVAVPENIMKMIMQQVSEDCVVVIDTLENMGGTI